MSSVENELWYFFSETETRHPRRRPRYAARDNRHRKPKAARAVTNEEGKEIYEMSSLEKRASL